MPKPDKLAAHAPDCSDLDELEREAEQHAQPAPILVRAILLGVREMRLLRAALTAPPKQPPPPPPAREGTSPDRRG